MREKRPGPGPESLTPQLHPQDELGVIARPNPSLEDMRFTEPTTSDSAKFAEPGNVVLVPTDSGSALVTKSELNKSQ